MDIALVIAATEEGGGRMASRVPAFVHPVAGRPLVWHTVTTLLSGPHPPDRVVAAIPEEYAGVIADHLPANVRLVDPGSEELNNELASLADRVLVVDASGYVESAELSALRNADGYGWIGDGDGEVTAAILDAKLARKSLDLAKVVAPAAGSDEGRRDGARSFNVRTRADLARMQRRVRDRIVAGHMDAGVTFLLPESVMVDVDVRIGRDTVLYPGVVLEGATTIGEETVIGPGCRVIDSWIGSGVELKGWNYIANASVRNRAILEPYVRRGFD